MYEQTWDLPNLKIALFSLTQVQVVILSLKQLQKRITKTTECKWNTAAPVG